MAEPELLCPSRPEEAVEALGAEGALAVGGGTSVGLLLRQSLIEPSRLVWLGQVEALQVFEATDGVLRIGGGVTLRQLERHPELLARLPAVAAAAGAVGNPRVRAVATVGGALAHADPRQDLPPALAACGATAEVLGPDGTRRVPVGELATGLLETVLDPAEIIVSVELPAPERRRSVYLRYNPGSQADFPTVSVAASADIGPSGEPVSVRLALAGVASTVLEVPEARLLCEAGESMDGAIEEVARAAARRSEPVSDRLGSAAYKKEMAAVWARRALRACLGPLRDQATGRPD